MPMSLSCLLLLTLSMLSNCFAARSGPLRAYEFYTNFVDIDCRTTEDPLMGWLHVLPTVIRFDLSLDEEENFVLEAYESEKEEVGSKASSVLSIAEDLKSPLGQERRLMKSFSTRLLLAGHVATDHQPNMDRSMALRSARSATTCRLLIRNGKAARYQAS
ncbi:uncharacterized protein L969DRAFT_103896 [Mixia osmundae IAM 14324]|uniref:Uncharacterized protein n=1 Tax=Mixia osmundae (strain CBS 9802 / IAM 14324 / JCM 22182 / KY 12970) TaxID=764103 RepID=G7E7D8_MIXOS|nr:uncharacterized protein L969DRAFT_103896 [Mixia osmundae IAM 14324]KEI38907.1 hypothetical protein L969DRAFT_103896 [Mixia osmundae IAM 14324]GAA98748.1 hypothetical protein E5Q_05436 [Mixia osmundae IAM 14324]